MHVQGIQRETHGAWRLAHDVWNLARGEPALGERRVGDADADAGVDEADVKFFLASTEGLQSQQAGS